MFVSSDGKILGPRLRPGEMRQAVGALRERGYAYNEIARELGISKSTVAYHARRLGIPADDKCARRYDWDAIQRAYDSGLSVRQCAAQFGFNLATWHQAKQRGKVVARPHGMPLEELLVADRPQTNRSHLKQRLITAGLKENRCERCGLTEWNGEPLHMQLHHRNGIGKDNRLENICFLCPNCHAQTPSWGGRNGNGRSLQDPPWTP
jgi:hypothetical protein